MGVLCDMDIQIKTVKESILSCLEILKQKKFIGLNEYVSIVEGVEKNDINSYEKVRNILKDISSYSVDTKDKTC